VRERGVVETGGWLLKKVEEFNMVGMVASKCECNEEEWEKR
jgi:hypothetical protein